MVGQREKYKEENSYRYAEFDKYEDVDSDRCMEAGKLKTFTAGLQGEDPDSCQLLILHFLGVRSPLQQLPSV